MPNFKNLLIFGAGGFGREVAWLAEQAWGSSIQCIFAVSDKKYLSQPINGMQVTLISEIAASDNFRSIIAIGDPIDRRKGAETCREFGFHPTIIKHPRIEISKWVEVEDGCIICAGCILTTNIILKKHVHINIDCTIGHDVHIGEFTTLSPGVHVSGNVHIGKNVFIGTGANIINGASNAPLTIGDNAIIAAGSCVTRAVEPGALVAGVPATRKR